jgi:hypothetical protein
MWALDGPECRALRAYALLVLRLYRKRAALLKAGSRARVGHLELRGEAAGGRDHGAAALGRMKAVAGAAESSRGRPPGLYSTSPCHAWAPGRLGQPGLPAHEPSRQAAVAPGAGDVYGCWSSVRRRQGLVHALREAASGERPGEVSKPLPRRTAMEVLAVEKVRPTSRRRTPEPLGPARDAARPRRPPRRRTLAPGPRTASSWASGPRMREPEAHRPTPRCRARARSRTLA